MPRRTAHVRGYATRAHAAETLDWARQFEELLRDANAILEPALGLHLESSGVSLWQPAAPEDRLETVLDELAQHDPADSVDWVVGFVKSTPELVFDYHHLGMGRLLSKYLVMRASNDPRELELLSREYYDLSDAEKGKLHTERKRHRWLVVFLHELGHTLGARHRVEAGSIMSPAYDPEHRAFDGTTLGLFGITVGKDLGSPSVETYRAVHDYYEAHRAGWVPSEREDTLAWLARLRQLGAHGCGRQGPVARRSRPSRERHFRERRDLAAAADDTERRGSPSLRRRGESGNSRPSFEQPGKLCCRSSKRIVACSKFRTFAAAWPGSSVSLPRLRKPIANQRFVCSQTPVNDRTWLQSCVAAQCPSPR